MKRIVFVLSVVALVLIAGVAEVVAKDAPKGPQAVTNYGDKPVATFNHDTHTDIGCAKCHHNEGDGKYKCGDCHKEFGKLAKADKKMKKADKIKKYHKEALHANCKGCHKKFNKKYKPKKAPTTCTKCHPKKK